MHVMLDLETLGTHANAPIVAIGACQFDENKVLADSHTFYRTVTLSSSMASGATPDPDTILWWIEQSPHAQRQIVNAEHSLENSLAAFTHYLRCVPDLQGVWGNGSDFDNAILAQSYRRLQLDIPWSHRQNRCYRTIKGLYPPQPKPQPTIPHHALYDAVAQAQHAQSIAQANEIEL